MKDGSLWSVRDYGIACIGILPRTGRPWSHFMLKKLEPYRPLLSPRISMTMSSLCEWKCWTILGRNTFVLLPSSGKEFICGLYCTNTVWLVHEYVSQWVAEDWLWWIQQQIMMSDRAIPDKLFENLCVLHLCIHFQSGQNLHEFQRWCSCTFVYEFHDIFVY